MEKIIILGTGCAGLTAAVYAARANLEPLVIEGIQPGGQLTTTSEVENFPGFPEGVDGWDLMNRMREQAKKFGARFESDKISRITTDTETGIKTLKGGEKDYQAEAVIVATGASPRLLGIPGEKEMFGGKGVTTCATCDGAFYRDMDVCVIGGGDSACEEALFLTRFCSKVTLIHRRDALRASQIMADRAVNHEKIEMLWDSVVTEIVPDEEGRVAKVITRNVKTDESGELAVKGVFIAIGHIPNTEMLEGLVERDDEGYVVPLNGSAVKTNVPGLYAAGDCADHVFRQAITAAGMGCQAAISAERWLAERD